MRHDPGHGDASTGAAKLDDVTARTIAGARETLLGTRVSRIISSHPKCLQLLVNGGFEPLANPIMRKAMAGTVTLRQAFQIRGLDDEAEEKLITALLELGIAGDGN